MEDIIENNKLIAEFMNIEKPKLSYYSKVKITAEGSFYGYEGIFNGHRESDSISVSLKDNSCRWFDIGDFEVLDYTDYAYNKDWNMLMPVVEKIETLNNNGFDFDIFSDGVIITRYRKDNNSDLVDGLEIVRNTRTEIGFENKLEVCYLSVIDFIKWYNKTASNKL